MRNSGEKSFPEHGQISRDPVTQLARPVILKELHRKTHQPREHITSDVVEGALPRLDESTHAPVGDERLHRQDDEQGEDRPVDAGAHTLHIQSVARLEGLCERSSRNSDELAQIIGKRQRETRRDEERDQRRKKDGPVAIEIAIEGKRRDPPVLLRGILGGLFLRRHARMGHHGVGFVNAPTVG